MNTVCINGRLTKEPIVKSFADSGKGSQNKSTLCMLYIANDVYYGETKTTGFFKVVAWNHLSSLISQYCSAGSELFITGRLEQYSYKDENNVDHYEVQVVVENFNFGGQPKSKA